MNHPDYGHPQSGRHRHQTPPSSAPPGRAPAEPGKKARTEAKLARQVAAVASLAAGAVHIAATPTHWQEWPLAGIFFAAIAAFQLIWGLLAIWIGNAFLRVVGLLANLGTLGLWAVSRVYGVPFGPHAGAPEAVGTADLVATALEVVVVAGLLWSLLPRERHGVLAAAGYRTVVVVAFLALGSAAVMGATAAPEHRHGGGGHDHDQHAPATTEPEPSDPADSATPTEPDADTSTPAEKDSTDAPADDGHTHAPGHEHG